MKKVIYFHLNNCPHCLKANRLLEEIINESSQYSGIEIERIEENKNAEIANKYDYFYVPCFYVDGEKLHEGVATKNDILAVLNAALA